MEVASTMRPFALRFAEVTNEDYLKSVSFGDKVTVELTGKSEDMLTFSD